MILRRMGQEILDAVERGKKKSHGPIPKQEGAGRRRMDRRTERRLARLKRWRSPRAKELNMDPGVLCPNAVLEAIAWSNPKKGKDLASVPEVKAWFLREFGDEVAGVLGDDSMSEPVNEKAREKKTA